MSSKTFRVATGLVAVFVALFAHAGTASAQYASGYGNSYNSSRQWAASRACYMGSMNPISRVAHTIARGLAKTAYVAERILMPCPRPYVTVPPPIGMGYGYNTQPLVTTVVNGRYVAVPAYQSGASYYGGYGYNSGVVYQPGYNQLGVNLFKR